jgi:hypothetical protein
MEQSKEKNKDDIIKDLNKTIKFSPKKIKENSIAPYSTLNPETNSDSHSAKSKGVRFSSIIKVNNKTTKKINIG